MRYMHNMYMSKLMQYAGEIKDSQIFEDEDAIDGSIEQPTLLEFLSTNRQEGKLLITHLTYK